MEVGDHLKKMNMTTEEVSRFTKAFQDETFTNAFFDYVKDLSDPENKRRYEEEITLLEQQRGNTVDFIHPQPFKVIKTSVDGKQKCFINICSNAKVGKPENKSAVREDGCRGQCWSLPHSLHPGRPDTDNKGNQVMIYDVVFHPDTLHIASKNKQFMKMVDNTAIDGIQNAFKVTVDKNNVKDLKMKYKGIPRPCVIRKPIPGFKAKESYEGLDNLLFPKPDDQSRNQNSDLETKSVVLQPEKTTEPKYTVKYRSFVNLQDFRCSRDSAQSPRPREIVVTVDLPLLKSVTGTDLEVKENILMLECKKPAYRLQLPLAYTVDEEKAQAQFNKQSRQLIITLAVCSAPSALECLPGQDSTGNEMEMSEEEWKEMKQEVNEVEGTGEVKGQDVKQEEIVEQGDENKRELTDGDQASESEIWWEPVNGKSLQNELESVVQEGNLNEKSQINQKSIIENNKTEREDKWENDGEAGFQKQPSIQPECISAGKNSTLDNKIVVLPEDNQLQENKEVNVSNTENREHIPKTSQMTDTGEMGNSRRADPDQGDADSSEFMEESVKQEDEDTDDAPQQNIFHTLCDKPETSVLREIDQDGNETVISDHSTWAGFTFKNKLMYELD